MTIFDDFDYKHQSMFLLPPPTRHVNTKRVLLKY
jgi:hypothetical protein